MRFRVPFPTGQLLAMQEWPGGGSGDPVEFVWRLWQGDWSPDESVEVFVADIGGTEITAPEYGEEPVVGFAPMVTLPAAPGETGLITFPSDDPTFGVLSGGEIAEWLVLVAKITDDSDSLLVAAMGISHTCNGGTEALFELDDTYQGLTVATTCTSAF